MSRDYRFLRWLGTFPPGLDTETDPVDLQDGFTPDGYGYDLNADGRLAKGTIPTGTARIAKTVSIAGNTWNWYFNRTWRADGNILHYNAALYDDVVLPPELGRIPFAEDAESIVTFLPFGGSSFAVFKSTGSYVLSNLLDTRAGGFFQKSDIMQEISVSAAANVTELDGAAYASASGGVFAFTGGEVTEITRLVRSNLTPFADIALTCDYDDKRVIGTDSFVYDVPTKRLFNFATAGFRYTTPTFHAADFSPFLIDRIIFIIENTDGEDGDITYQFKWEDEDWTDEEIKTCRGDNNRYTQVPLIIDRRIQARRFQLRLTDIDTNIRIREIRMDVSGSNFDDYSL